MSRIFISLMKKNNIKDESLCSWRFLRVCIGNFLLFMSVYLLLPLLPVLMRERVVDISIEETASLFLLFISGMLAAGPFHAYLGDTYKRKNVLAYSTLLLVVSGVGYLWVNSFAESMLLACVQGVSFGVAATAGITVAIDITPSKLRNDGNVAYSLIGRLGMLAGIGVGGWLLHKEGAAFVVYLSLLSGGLSVLLSMRIYLPFRAPMGVRLCSSDRFWLKRGWLLALNVLMFAFFSGVLLLSVSQGERWVLGILLGLVVAVIPFTRLFIKLSQHCQRGSANTMCQLAIDTGLLLGMAAAYSHVNTSLLKGSISHLSFGGLAFSLLVFLFLTYPHHKRKRVRE